MPLTAKSLAYHASIPPGKLAVATTKPCDTPDDLSLAYSPGVAAPCLAIRDDPTAAFRYTGRSNLVAVITNGTAVLGLGNIGPMAAKPVMEGKAVLFKRFADIDAFDLELAADTAAEVIQACVMLQPTFGGINLEDIKAPECFEIEAALRERLAIPVGEASFDLVQYHFHSPSEHTLSGRHYPMEMHMVHRSAAGTLAVVGVLIAEGRHNPAFEPVWNNLPRAKGVETHCEHVTVDVDALLPSSHASYRYQGSLTTPPCTEGVEWIVLSTSIELDRQQIETFEAIIHDNSRPVQALNGRMVLADTVR